MDHSQAKRRKKKRNRKLGLPKIPATIVTGIFMAIAIVVVTFKSGVALLDHPIGSIEINGPFQRVTALQIEEVASEELHAGFLSADLTEIQKTIVALPWIAHANVERRWPGEIVISVTEQIPAARWGERGLLNTHGELFVANASHVPAELPQLSGPENQAAAVAMRYLAIREQLIPLGMDVRGLTLDKRGAWDMTLRDGIEIRFGRRDVANRIRLFLDLVAKIVSSRETEIEFVDMRYGSGFSIGWKQGTRSPAKDADDFQRELLAERMQ